MLIPQVFYSTRGTPLSAYHRIKDLIELGYEVEVLTYRLGDPPPDLDIVVHRSHGPHFATRLKQGPSYPKIWFDALLFLNLLYRLARSRYDVVYAHEEGGFLAALAAPLFRVPFVYDMHSSLPLQIRDWKFSDREWVVRLFGWVERFTLRRSLAAVAISPGVAAAATRAVADVPVVTIVNRFAVETAAAPAETERIRRALGIRPDHRVVLYTGSFVALQALDLLVRAIPAVIARVPRAHFVLVGGQPAQIADLARLVQNVGVTDHVQLLEARPQAEMPAFMGAADVLVSPRVQGINPPGKLFSYLSSGKPVVATDTPVHNQILNTTCAVLTAPTVDGLAEGLIAALTDSALVRRVTRGAEEMLRVEYGPDARVAAYERLAALLSRRTDAASRRS